MRVRLTWTVLTLCLLLLVCCGKDDSSPILVV